MNISRKHFGTLSDGRDVFLFTLEAGDLRFSVSEFGAAWTSLIVPSRRQGPADILLGFSTLEGYIHNRPSLGVTVGRFANRIGGASFTLNGKTYGLYKNDGNNSLHGGRVGFSKKLWKGEGYTSAGGVFVRMELFSPDGEEGYPGNLRAAVNYGINPANELWACYEAFVDQPCPVNLTNHAYFNLAGEGSGTILAQELKLYASSYVEPGEDLIPTGKLLPLAGTPLDFTKPKAIGRDYGELCGGDTEALGKGYDHCFVLEGYAEDKGAPENKPLLPCAEVRDPGSGRSLAVSSTQPGVQFYSGNFLAGIPGKAGSVYGKNAGFCLETQHFPDSPNRDKFPGALFGPDRPYHEKTVFSLKF
ncbi:MAG: galactose mutarotase [Spirochaetaceae bacterium]|jgi:aldose 1-epimerase|nr:galactose mutarotase [Spirochaetaceae bacterium]